MLVYCCKTDTCSFSQLGDSAIWLLVHTIQYYAGCGTTKLYTFTIKPPYVISTLSQELDVVRNFVDKEVGKVSKKLLNVAL